MSKTRQHVIFGQLEKVDVDGEIGDALDIGAISEPMEDMLTEKTCHVPAIALLEKSLEEQGCLVAFSPNAVRYALEEEHGTQASLFATMCVISRKEDPERGFVAIWKAVCVETDVPIPTGNKEEAKPIILTTKLLFHAFVDRLPLAKSVVIRKENGKVWPEPEWETIEEVKFRLAEKDAVPANATIN